MYQTPGEIVSQLSEMLAPIARIVETDGDTATARACSHSYVRALFDIIGPDASIDHYEPNGDASITFVLSTAWARLNELDLLGFVSYVREFAL